MKKNHAKPPRPQSVVFRMPSYICMLNHQGEALLRKTKRISSVAILEEMCHWDGL